MSTLKDTARTENSREDENEAEAKKEIDKTEIDGPGPLGSLPMELRRMIFDYLPESIGTMRLVIFLKLTI